jgi:hypothetical protein
MAIATFSMQAGDCSKRLVRNDDHLSCSPNLNPFTATRQWCRDHCSSSVVQSSASDFAATSPQLTKRVQRETFEARQLQRVRRLGKLLGGEGADEERDAQRPQFKQWGMFQLSNPFIVSHVMFPSY